MVIFIFKYVLQERRKLILKKERGKLELDFTKTLLRYIDLDSGERSSSGNVNNFGSYWNFNLNSTTESDAPIPPYRYFGSSLKLNNNEFLRILFKTDKSRPQEVYFRSHRSKRPSEKLFTIEKLPGGLPVKFKSRFSPRSLNDIEIFYTKTSKISSWAEKKDNKHYRNISFTYDDQDRLTKILIDGRAESDYRYHAGHKVPRTIERSSGRQFHVKTDDNGFIKEIISQSLAHNRFHKVLSPNLHRLVYQRHRNERVLFDFDAFGRCKYIRLPSNERRISYNFLTDGRLLEEMYDMTSVKYLYQSHSNELAAIHLEDGMEDQGKISLNYFGEIVINLHRVEFQKEDLKSMEFNYKRNDLLRVTEIKGHIGEENFPTLTYNYNDLGGVEYVNSYYFRKPSDSEDILGIKRIIVEKKHDLYNKLEEVIVMFGKRKLYSISVKRDARGRPIRQDKYRRSSGGDVQFVQEYSYKDEGIKVYKEQSRDILSYNFNFEENGGFVMKNDLKGNEQEFRMNVTGEVLSMKIKGKETVFAYDIDGYCIFAKSKKQKIVFEWSAKSQIQRITDHNFDIRYVYDGLGRLTARIKESRVIQFFYSDLSHPGRVTHIYDNKVGKSVFIYDRNGRLAVIIQRNRTYTVILDGFDSIAAIYDAETGEEVVRVNYDPLGRMKVTGQFEFYLGYRGGIHETEQHLVVLLNGRLLHTIHGMYLAPDYQAFIKDSHKVLTHPEMLYLYLPHFPGLKDLQPPTDPKWWLNTFALNVDNFIHKIGADGSLNSILDYRTSLIPTVESTLSISTTVEASYNEREKIVLNELSPFLKPNLYYKDLLFTPLTAKHSYPLGEGMLLAVRPNLDVSLKSSKPLISKENKNLMEKMKKVFNHTKKIDGVYTKFGKDYHYFVYHASGKVGSMISQGLKRTEELANVSLKIEDVVEANYNVRKSHTDLTVMRLDNHQTTFKVRDGMSYSEVKDKVKMEYEEYAIRRAWKMEKERVELGMRTRSKWTNEQMKELKEGENVQSAKIAWRWTVDPQAYDDPNNIIFDFAGES